MTNHTSGPWVLSNVVMDNDREGTYVIVFCPDGVGYGRVAMVFAECGREEELHHNARLIAAAPELLDALTELAKCHIEGGFVQPDKDVLYAANDAIAKATQ